MTPVLQAHRGASHAAPENTLRAFELALAEGADAIELDLRLTADAVPVVFHDDNLARMTGRPGRLSATPLAALTALRAGGEPIPTLAEVVRFSAEHRLPLNLEIKPSSRPQVTVDACEPHLRALMELTTLMVSSFDPRALAILHQRLPALTLALIFDDLRALAALPHLPPVDLHPRHDLIVPEHLPSFLGRPLRAWTVDDADEARRLLALPSLADPGMPAVHALVTNRPGPLRAELRAPIAM